MKKLDDLESYSDWDLVKLAVCNSDKTLLFGPPGTGKTTAGVFEGDPTDVFKITVHEEMSAAEILGHYIPDGEQFVWHDGVAIRAWKTGARLVIDEIDRASGDVRTLLYAILDDKEVAALSLPNGETVMPADGFTCVATMNGTPEDLPDALVDRFTAKVKVSKPNTEAFKAFNDPVVAQLAEKDAMSSQQPSIRGWKAFDKLRLSMDDGAAMKLAFPPSKVATNYNALVTAAL